MIKDISGNSEYLTVSGSGGYNTPYINMTNPSAGMVRYNGSNFEVYDGSVWIGMNMGYTHIDVSGKTREILQWAEAKMHQEREIMQLVETNPTVADAYNTYKEAADKLAVVMKLTQE